MNSKDLKRKSKPSFSNSNIHRGHHSMMFTQDLGSILIKKDADLKPFAKNETVENLFSQLHFQRHYYSSSHQSDFKETIIEVIQLIQNHLIYHGRIVFELISETKENNLSYYLVNVQGVNLKKRFLDIKQTTQGGNGNLESTNIPKNKCIIIDFPEFLGGRKKYLKLLSDFDVLDSNVPIHIFKNKLIDSSPYYDSMNHHKKMEIELRRISKPYKWHHRDNLGNNDLFSQFYSNLKTIEFMKTRAQLRDFIIEELNKTIKFVSNKIELGTAPIIKFENIVSIEELDEIINDYKIGKIGRKEIFNLTLKV
jgi:hypothetical protein